MSSSSSSSSSPSKDDSPPPPKPASHLRGAMAGTESSFYEALHGLLGGMIYGLVSPIVGHPLDTIKTKLQAAPQYAQASAWTVVRDVWKHEGIGGFYRGFIPPLLGSTAYRGILFSAYAGTFAACQQNVPVLAEPIPYTGGLRPSVLVGGVAAGFARAIIESPLDFIKVRNQLKQSTLAGTSLGVAKNGHQLEQWSFKAVQQLLVSVGRNPVGHVVNLYSGFVPTLLRTIGLLGSFFVMVDYSVRYLPEIMNAPLLGPFFKGGICATLAWVPAFPLETAKSIIQADPSGSKTTRQVLTQLYREKGIWQGWYRGFGPGASRSFIANGTSMIIYSWYQETTRSWIASAKEKKKEATKGAKEDG